MIRPRNALQRAGDALVVEQARRGRTLQQIADALGVTREAVRQRLRHAGRTIKDFPRFVCAYCGAPLAVGKATARWGLHACLAPACVARYNAEAARRRALDRRDERLGGAARAACASCGRVLERTAPRGDGYPSFCSARVCVAARIGWLIRHDPAYREWNRRAAAADRRGEPRPTVGQVRRELGLPPPTPGRKPAPEAEAAARAVLARRGGGASERTVARELGVARSTVNAIWTGKRWPALSAGAAR